MAEYIEREAVWSILEWDNDIQKWVVMWNKEVDDIPAADVVEVVHGKWEKWSADTFAIEHGCRKLRCSACSHFYYYSSGDGKRYCPNCGARMDGE